MKNYLITGATGFIGKRLIEKLNNETHIYAIVRDVQKAENIYGDTRADITFIQWSIDDSKTIENVISLLPEKVDYVIHCAANTDSKRMIEYPVETANGIVIGTRNVLELARLKQVESLVYLSSMEVYGSINLGEKRVTEDTLGDIDICNVRSTYPLGKRMAELYCLSYYKEYGVPVKVARLAQVFGSGILPTDNRVFAQFAKSVISNKDIILHTDGTSMGNYVDTDDAIDAIMLLLNNGENGEAYNIVNEDNTMMIRDMAELVASEVAGGKIKVIFDIPKDNIHGYAAKTGLRLSSSKINALGWQAKKNLVDMYKLLIHEMTTR